MPIYAKDKASLDKGAQALMQLILGNKNKMAEAEQQKNLDEEKNQEEINQGIQGVKDLKSQGLITEGGGVNVKGVGVTRGYNPFQIEHTRQAQQLNEMKALQKAAKDALSGPQADLETADMIHKLMVNPSAIDQGTAQLMKARMAMGGSGGRALGAALRTMGMDAKTMAGDAQDWANWFSGNAHTTMTPQQMNALNEGAFKLGSDATERFNRGKQQFVSQAAMLAPGMASNGSLTQALPTFSAPGDDLVNRLSQRQKEYQQQAAGAPTGLDQAPAYKEPSGPIDKLKNFLTGGPSPAPAAPQASGGGGLQDAVAAEIARRKAAPKAGL